MPTKFTLREWRHVREYSCQKMADICGVHVNTYRAWESEPEKIPISMAYKLAGALGTSIDNISFVKGTT